MRLAVQITAVAVLVAAALLVLGPARAEFDRRFAQAKAEAVTQLEQLLGRRVTYSSISPSILRYLSVRDLTVHGTDTDPGDLLTVQQLRIYYRPLRLLQGRYAEAFSEVRIENTVLTFDTRAGDLFTSILADLTAARADASAAALLPDDLTVSGRNIRLSLESPLGRVETHRLFFTTSIHEQIVNVRAQGDLRLAGTPNGLPVSSVSGYFEAVGSVNVDSGETLFELALPEISSDAAVISGQVLQVRFSDGVLEARNVQSRDPIDIYLRYIDAEGELYARILADGYRLGDLVRLSGPYDTYNQYLAVPVRGQANVTVTPQRVSFGGSLLSEIPEFSGLPSGEVTLRFSGDERNVLIDELLFVSSAGTVEFEGTVGLEPLRPTGRLTLRNVTYGGIDPLTMAADLRSSGDTVSVSAGRFAYAGSTFSSLRGSVSLADAPSAELTVELQGSTHARFEIATEHHPDGSFARGRVDARGIVPERLIRIQQALVPDLHLPDLAALPGGIVIDTRVDIDVTEGLSVTVPLFYAFDSQNADDHLSLSLSYVDGSVIIRDLLARYQGYEGRGDFVARIENGGVVRFTSDVVVEDIPYQFTGRFKPDNSLEIQGLYDVDARFYFGERDEIVFRASGDLPLPLLGAEAGRLAFSVDGYYFSASDWSARANRLLASGIPVGPAAVSDVSLAGAFSPAGARLTSFTYSDAFSEVSGRGDVVWDLGERRGSVELDLSGEDGETYSLAAAYADGSIDARAQFGLLPLLRLGIETVRGSLTGSLAVEGPLDALSAAGRFELIGGKFNNDPIELAAEVEVDPASVRLIEAGGRYGRSFVEGARGSFAIDRGALELTATLAQQTETGRVSVGVEAAGGFTDLAAVEQVATADFAGTIRLLGLPVRDDLPPDWTFTVSRGDGLTRFFGGPDGALSVAVRPGGAFRASVGAPLPVRFDAVGLVDGGAIEADLINIWGDAGRLWAAVESPGFGFTDGVVTGSLRVVGPLNDPDFYGTLVVDDVMAELDVLPDPIGPARTFVVFDEKMFHAREMSVPAGPGRARVSMEMTMDRWLPEQFRVNIATEPDAPVRVAYDFGGAVIDGRATGTVQVDGTLTSTRVTGAVTGSSMTITLSEVPDEVPLEEQPNDLSVDLTVRTGRGVEFRWPTSAFPILRGFAGVGETVRVTHESTTGAFSLTGGVSIQGGEVFYFDRSFYIREGRITFDENEVEFDPLVTVNAEIREVADEGPVRIYLVAEERPLSEFTPRWRSDPPLTEAAIIALLGGSVFVGEGGGPLDFSDAVLLTSDVVSQFAIIRGFESSVRDALQLDLFSIRTQLFQNLLRGVIGPVSYPLDTGAPSLGQYLDNTTLFMGKYLGTDLFLELLVQLRASQPLAYEPPSLAGIDVESEFSLEWRTPFFLLEWSFFPRDPSSLFLADNTISFSWEYSY